MKEADEETKAVTQTDRKTFGKKVDFAEWEENKETKRGQTQKKKWDNLGGHRQSTRTNESPR